MHLLLSPAKTLDMEPAMEVSNYSLAPFQNEAKELIVHLKKLKATDLQNLMGVSSKIAELNADRFEQWQLPFDLTNSKQAIFAFKGDVYTGLEAESLTETEIAYAQKNLSILSGLYGILKPLDLMQAYRLEMGTKLPNKNGENLFGFVEFADSTSVTRALNIASRKLNIVDGVKFRMYRAGTGTFNYVKKSARQKKIEFAVNSLPSVPYVIQKVTNQMRERRPMRMPTRGRGGRGRGRGRR